MKQIFAIALAILLLAGSGCVSKQPTDTADPVIKPYKSRVVLTRQQKRFLLGAARTALQGNPLPEPDDLLAAIGGAGAIVELFLSPEKPIITVVDNENFYTAFEVAIAKTASDPRFAESFQPKLDRVRIKLSILDEILPLKVEDLHQDQRIFRAVARRIEPGVHGIALAINGEATYQIPERVLYDGWGLNIHTPGEREKRVRGRALVQRQIQTLSSEATGDKNGWRNGDLYAFTTQSFIEAAGKPGQPKDVFRANTNVPSLDAKSLRAALLLDLGYLQHIVSPKGTLDYIYYPNEDELSPEYEIVRHAGYAFRMIQAANALEDEAYFEAGSQALNYALLQTRIPQSVSDIAIVKFEEEANLGAMAVTALAIAEIPKHLMWPRHPIVLERLGKALLYMRMPEDGLFYATFEQAEAKKAPEQQPLYWPGAAMLAWVKMFEKSGDKRWWDAAVKTSKGQQKLWSEAGSKGVGRFCWVGQAWSRMARIEKDPALRDHYKTLAYSHADAVIERTWTPDRRDFLPDYLGAADNSRPPRSTPTSARAEALGEAYITARYLKDTEAQKKYGVALMQALAFVVRNQFTIENTWYLPHPEKAIGGIRGGLIANDIRIDYCQHALAAMLYALDVPDDLKALGVKTW
jgi:hypothetical protein